MRLWPRCRPTRVPFTLVTTIRGGEVWADIEPCEVGPDHVLFPSGARVYVDERGNPSVIGSVDFRLRAVGPNAAISIGGG